MRLLPYSLQRRFLLGLLLIVLIIGIFFTMLLRHHMRELFLSETHSKADLMVAHVEAIQHYVRNVLRPRTSALLGSDKFIIETMSSSYVSRRILSGLNLENSAFTYRRVAKNARNPDYEVNKREGHFFSQFLEDPGAERKEEIIMADGKEQLVIARPVYFNASCMRCHGDPSEAPAGLVKMYGAERGFNRQPGELAGLDIISVCMENATGAIGRSVTLFALFFILGMFVLLLSVQGFFNRLVVHNLRRVGQILQQNFPQEENEKVLAPLRFEVEIEGMIQSIEAVAAHLGEARRQLSDYAKNLEGMVKERTADLESILKARSADVRLFMRLLSDLNSSKEKRTLLHTSLRLIARHFEADKAAYVCGLSGVDHMEWPGTGEKLPQGKLDALFQRLRQGEASMEGEAWYIPVQTSGQTRGMLGIYWDADPPEYFPGGETHLHLHRQSRESYFAFAMSLGTQLGIALDNFDALDALLRQNNLLESIVEGVHDPLILIERDHTPVMANTPARELASRLLGDAPDGIRSLLKLMELPSKCKFPGKAGQYEIILTGERSFAVSMHPLPNNSVALRAVVHLRETTEEKRILGHMRQTEKLAAVGQLAAGLAHEINNPLGVIRCYAELLGASVTDEQGMADLAVIMRHVEQAQTVLSDMLNFSRQREPSPGYCRIVDLLHELQEIFRPQARAATVELVLETGTDLPDVYVDRNMLEQVIVNLLLNGLDAVKKAHPSGGGRLRLLAQRDGNSVVISVADNGRGVRAEILPKIFEPFFTTKEPGEGTGLGLSIAFGLVNDLGGRLEVESPPGGGRSAGAVFNVIIPA